MRTVVLTRARVRRLTNGASLSSPGTMSLKSFEGEGTVRVEPTRLLVISRHELLATADR